MIEISEELDGSDSLISGCDFIVAIVLTLWYCRSLEDISPRDRDSEVKFCLVRERNAGTKCLLWKGIALKSGTNADDIEIVEMWCLFGEAPGVNGGGEGCTAVLVFCKYSKRGDSRLPYTWDLVACKAQPVKVRWR